MKKIIIALQVCAVIGLASCNKNDQVADKKTTSSTTSPAGDIVYVNTDSLVSRYQFAKDIQKEP